VRAEEGASERASVQGRRVCCDGLFFPWWVLDSGEKIKCRVLKIGGEGPGVCEGRGEIGASERQGMRLGGKDDRG